MPSPLVSTKLYVPGVRRGLVPRRRLADRLGGDEQPRLTLVAGPAGFGKTTLLAAWARAAAAGGRAVAWVSLEETEQEPTSFWTSGADPASLTVTANALVDVRNWTFLFGPGLMPVFNAVLFGTLLYRSRLVPRLIPTVGLIGAPLLFAAFVAALFGGTDQVSAVSFFLTLPVAAWELSVGLWMTFKGFRPEAVAALEERDLA